MRIANDIRNGWKKIVLGDSRVMQWKANILKDITVM